MSRSHWVAASAVLFATIMLASFAQAAVLFSGITHEHEGAATIALSADAQRLTVVNLGSTGQDGVRLELNGIRGASIPLSTPMGAAPVLERQLAVVGTMSDGTPVTMATFVHGSAAAPPSGSNVNWQFLGGGPLLVSLFNGDRVVASLEGSVNNVDLFDGTGAGHDQPSSRGKFSVCSVDNPALGRALQFTHEFEIPLTVTLAGQTYTASKLEVVCPTSDESTQIEFMTVTGTGGSVPASMEIELEGLRVKTPRKNHTATYISVGTSDIATVANDELTVTDPNLMGSEVQVSAPVRTLMATPPAGHDPLNRLSLQWAWVEDLGPVPDGSVLRWIMTSSLQGIAEPETASVTFTKVTVPGLPWYPAFSYSHPQSEGTVSLFLNGNSTPGHATFNGSSHFVMRCSQAPRSVDGRCDGGRDAMGFAFPPGTQIELDGQVFDADSVVLRQMKLSSGQPAITENKKGLLVSFQLPGGRASLRGVRAATEPVRKVRYFWSQSVFSDDPFTGLHATGDGGMDVDNIVPETLAHKKLNQIEVVIGNFGGGSASIAPHPTLPPPNAIEWRLDGRLDAAQPNGRLFTMTETARPTGGTELTASMDVPGVSGQWIVTVRDAAGNKVHETNVPYPVITIEPAFVASPGQVSLNMVDDRKYLGLRTYDTTVEYKIGDTVVYGNQIYVAFVANGGGNPDAEVSTWGLSASSASGVAGFHLSDGHVLAQQFEVLSTAERAPRLTSSGEAQSYWIHHDTDDDGIMDAFLIRDVRDGFIDGASFHFAPSTEASFSASRAGLPSSASPGMRVRSSGTTTVEPTVPFYIGAMDMPTVPGSTNFSLIASEGDFAAGARLRLFQLESLVYDGPLTPGTEMTALPERIRVDQDIFACGFNGSVVITIRGSGAPELFAPIVADSFRISPTNPTIPDIRLDGLEVKLNDIPAIRFANARSKLIPSLVSVPDLSHPRTFQMASPSPNPASGLVSVQLALPSSSLVRAEVIDVAGRVVARVADGRFAAGRHSLRWDGRVSSGRLAAAGLYFLRVNRDGRESRVVRFTRLQ